MNRLASVADVRSHLIERREIAFIDVREEGVYAEAHPLFAVSLPLSRLELEVFERIPRLSVPIIVYDAGEGLAQRAAVRLGELGYPDVALLDGGLEGWQAAGAELFRDVNAPSKAFGELVEATRHTPSIDARELYQKVISNENVIVVDARRFEEYHVMSIPSATSVPGGELALRIRSLAPDPNTLVVVNCAGRTRSIIGAQSLINASTPNRVAALRNGTIGWTLAGLPLEHAQVRRHALTSGNAAGDGALHTSEDLARRAGVRPVDQEQLSKWVGDPSRTVYRFDVRTPEEYVAGHRVGFRPAPGGQLVQETDVFAPVRGARIVLTDDDGVRANMTASWLAQMGWEAYVLSPSPLDAERMPGPAVDRLPPLPTVITITAHELARQLQSTPVRIVDFASSAEYARGHLPTAWFALRSQLDRVAAAASDEVPIVFVSPDGVLASFVAPELEALTGHAPKVLVGGTAAWTAAGFEFETGPGRYLAPAIDRYKRPYEGTDNPAEAMQAYLDWEYGLVQQLQKDGTHHFQVI